MRISHIGLIGPAEGSGNEVEGIEKDGLRPMVHIGNQKGRTGERRGKARRLERYEGTGIFNCHGVGARRCMKARPG